MSVTIRPYRRGGWEVDIRVVAPDGTREIRERKRAPVSSRSAAVRWAEGRERVLFERLMKPPQDNAPPKEVPTLREFASRFLDGHARANRQKPSGIAAKEMILRVHLDAGAGSQEARRDQERGRATSQGPLEHEGGEDGQQHPDGAQRAAEEGGGMGRDRSHAVRGHAVAGAEDVDVVLRLRRVRATRRGTSSVDATAHLIVLLGGEAGLRCGEMIALEWRDVDLGKRQICVQRSDWNGQVTTPKGGRLRYVPLTIRLAAALRDHRHLRSPTCCARTTAQPLTRQMVQDRVLRASRRAKLSQRRGAHPASHVLFAPGDARRAGASDSGARRASRNWR